MNKIMTDTEKKQIYETAILPLVTEIKKECNTFEIPFFMLFGVKENLENDNLSLKAEVMLPEEFRIDSDNNKTFSDCVNILNGFKAVPKNDSDLSDMLSNIGPITDTFSPEDTESFYHN